MHNQEKTKQLCENWSTASHKLKKMLLFDFAGKLGMLECFHCGSTIDSIEEFSIEHKIPWLHSTDPRKYFFDTCNIAFSHRKCNCSARRCKMSTRNANGYKGVEKDVRYKTFPFRARVSVDGKMKTVGSFLTAQEAALAYDEAVVRWHGSKAVTNKSLGLV